MARQIRNRQITIEVPAQMFEGIGNKAKEIGIRRDEYARLLIEAAYHHAGRHDGRKPRQANGRSVVYQRENAATSTSTKSHQTSRRKLK